MLFKQEMVSASKLFDANSGVCLADTSATILGCLNKSEIERYARAMHKVQQGQGLNRQDLVVLDKIDQVTFDHHGMCLKDSAVTKARIKACKKHGLKFIDRDGLEAHMNMFIPVVNKGNRREDYLEAIAFYFIEHMGEGFGEICMSMAYKLLNGQLLNLGDLKVLSEMEAIATEQLGFSILTDDLVSAIDLASKNCGVHFSNLQRIH
ncbi:hypothetical protein ICN46_10805 [Polynucleobacter sp. Latsch14-2]|jgi:hypothetical protein|uniref:hypothetical protein n=1 Tax=Polynucleobacter sp. Latsch14-2 TaxID=2576920 RepID=UPI001C0DDBB1|nr:hypothetical protein [Polynucleobacter sp. Latsch14-2]MBU3615380.1 hypothetical protein [Polynucleobacter sp. Latsch14-2]